MSVHVCVCGGGGGGVCESEFVCMHIYIYIHNYVCLFSALLKYAVDTSMFGSDQLETLHTNILNLFCSNSMKVINMYNISCVDVYNRALGPKMSVIKGVDCMYKYSELVLTIQ